MLLNRTLVLLSSLFISGFVANPAHAVTAPYVAGFDLTEDGNGMVFDASTDVSHPTEAQKRVLQAKSVGANHIILNIRATMVGGTGTEIIPVTPPAQRSGEAQRMLRLIRYIKGQGLTVGLRPIFFVVGPNGEFPYYETQRDGTKKLWWHGNIQPADPNRWFESFRVYLDLYLLVAKVGQVDEFTLGAELYSMTVGIEDQWQAYPYGFPGRWLDLLRYVRGQLPKARLMYDINFTDDTVTAGGIQKAGGEMERWRYRLVDLANPTDANQLQIWKDLVSFWTELDAVGIDMYRSLADQNQNLPTDAPGLTAVLKQRSDSYATQLDTIASQISLTLGIDKLMIFKEVGFRSVDRGFVNPFTYAGSGNYNEMHQAVAYEAMFESFWAPQWPWFGGINFWEMPIDPAQQGQKDLGFCPLGKPMSEAVVKNYFQAKTH